MQVARLLGFTPAAVLKHVQAQGLPMLHITQQHLLDQLADACLIAPLQSSASALAVSAACRLLSAVGSTVAPPETLEQLKSAAASGPPQAHTTCPHPTLAAFPGVPQPTAAAVMDEDEEEPEEPFSDSLLPSSPTDFLAANTPSPLSAAPTAAAVAYAPAAASTLPSALHPDPHQPQQYIFPSILPSVRLTAAERGERYGIAEDALPAPVRKQLLAFKKWCTVIINLGRGKEYAMAVQVATIQKQLEHIRSYLGFALMKLRISRQDLSLEVVYANPQHLAKFIAYLLVSGNDGLLTCLLPQHKSALCARLSPTVPDLPHLLQCSHSLSPALALPPPPSVLQARGCARGHVTKHIGIARKVNEYLSSSTIAHSDAHKHHQRVREWLAVLETQVYQAVPSAPPPPDLPLYGQIRRWVLDNCRSALSAVNLDMERMGQLSKATARKVSRDLVTHQLHQQVTQAPASVLPPPPSQLCNPPAFCASLPSLPTGT